MKIVLDIDKLLAEEKITADEYERLKGFSFRETGSLAFNILVGFGVVATAGGALAMLPTYQTAIVLGLVLAVAGAFLGLNRAGEWGLLGSILLIVGAVMAGGGIVAWVEVGEVGFLIVTVLCMVAAVLAKSNLLTVMAALSLSATVGVMTTYGHGTYVLAIRQPTVTVILFSVLAFVAYQLSKRLPSQYERLAIVFSRTSVFLVNLGFWVGSLWGDSLSRQQDDWTLRDGAVISDLVFVIGWAVALIVVGVWASRANKRWVVNVLAVFGSIHFYTQFFERLHATPGSVLVAGLIAIAIAFGIVWYNKSATKITATT